MENPTSINIEQVKKQYNSQFNKELFSNLNEEPLWDQAKINLDDNDKTYLEIPYRNIKQIDLDKSTSVSLDRLIAFSNSDNTVTLRIVHYFAQDIKKSLPNLEQLTYFNSTEFNGFITLYDLNKNVINGNRYIDGKKTEDNYTVLDKKDALDLHARMPLACEVHTETIIIKKRWFWIYPNGMEETIHIEYVFQNVDYQICSSNGTPTQNGSSSTTVITKDVVVKVVNKLTDACASQIFEELKAGLYKIDPNKPEVITPNGNLTLSQQILLLFNESYKTDYTIQNGTTNGSNASTDPSNNTTTMSDSYLHNATKLSIARTMIHEQVHAYINSVHKWKSGFQDLSLYKKLKAFAADQGITDIGKFHHEFMANFINGMAYSLYEWDYKNGAGKGNLGWEYYKAMAYAGLSYDNNPDPNITELVDTDSFITLVPLKADRDNIKKIISDESKGKSNAKGKKCTP